MDSGGIDGAEGLILAGSNGADLPWPFSDVNLIPLYADATQAAAIAQAEGCPLIGCQFSWPNIWIKAPMQP